MVDRALILALIQNNDKILSRTAMVGSIDTSVSADKKRSDAVPQTEIQALLSRNQKAIAEYIQWRGDVIRPSGKDLFGFLAAISELTNLSMPSGHLYRVWQLPYGSTELGGQVAPENVEDALRGKVFLASREIGEVHPAQRMDLIARVEWEIGIGPIHPYSDGCGRISRYFSVLLSAIYHCDVVQHRSREEYYSNATSGIEPFQRYYRTLPGVSIRRVD